MINILVAPTDHYACDLYRCSGPHKKLKELYPNEFNIDINYNVNWELLSRNNNYDIIYLHNGSYCDDRIYKYIPKLKQRSIIVLDIDDYWELPKEHKGAEPLKKSGYTGRCMGLVVSCDRIITTQDYFANILKKYKQDVIVIPNAIDPKDSILDKNPSNRIRFGLVGSTCHEYDYKLLEQVPFELDNYLDKIQIVLCGFKNNFSYYKKGYCYYKSTEMREDNTWWLYEKLVTGDYRICSEEYKQELLKFNEEETLVNEPYQRLLNKPIEDYLNHYRNIDVLLAPLQYNDFSNCKSELKFIEAGLTNTAIIASNVEPYKVGTSIINSDGTINPNGNCLFANSQKEWVSCIKTYVDNPELIDLSKNNLRKFILDNYNIDDITNKRRNLYNRILYGTT